MVIYSLHNADFHRQKPHPLKLIKQLNFKQTLKRLKETAVSVRCIILLCAYIIYMLRNLRFINTTHILPTDHQDHR